MTVKQTAGGPEGHVGDAAVGQQTVSLGTPAEPDQRANGIDGVDEPAPPAVRTLTLVPIELDAPNANREPTVWLTGDCLIVAIAIDPATLGLAPGAPPSRQEASPMLTQARVEPEQPTAREPAGAFAGSAEIRALGLLLEDAGSPATARVGIRGGRQVLALGLAQDAEDVDVREADVLREIKPLLAALDRHVRRKQARRSSIPGGSQLAEPPVQSVGLTVRQTEALILLSRGLTASAAARRMGCSTRTVNKHLGDVYRRLGVRDRLHAVLVAQRLGLLPAPSA